VSTVESARREQWMACAFEGLAVGERPPREPAAAGLEEAYAESAAFAVRVVRGRADRIRAAEAPERERAGDRFLAIDELPELYLPVKQSASAQGPEWRAVRVRGARLYELAHVPLEVDGGTSRGAVSGVLYFDASTIAKEGAESEPERKVPEFGRGLDVSGWFVDPFPPLGCLFDTAVIALAIRYGRECLPAVLRFVAAYAALRAIRAFAPVATMRARVVRDADRTNLGKAILWGLWLLTTWLGAVAAYVAVTRAQDSTCAAADLRMVVGSLVAGAILVVSPAQRFGAPAVFAVPLALAGLFLTCPASNPACGAAASAASDEAEKPEARDPYAMPRPDAKPRAAPCVDPSRAGGSAEGMGGAAGAKGAALDAESLRNLRALAGDGGASWFDGLDEHAARVGGAVAGQDSDEHAMLEASGAAETRATLDQAESGDDPFREASGVVLHGASDTFCGKPLFLASSTLFAPGQSALSASGQVELRRVARLLLKHAKRTFLVAAHVPSDDEAKADALSKERAQSVTAWLKVWPGLEGANLYPVGLGARDGLVDDSGKGAVGRLNDRVEIGLSCGDGPPPSDAPARPKRKKRGTP
jgi:outer membrane protein OmpA-like peptidoglycan-associated protein